MKKYSRNELLKRIGSMSQLCGIVPVELSDGPRRGTRVFRVDNGTFCFDVLADRGMSIGQCRYRNVPLAFMTPAGEVNPAFCGNNGLEWLKTFPGGFLTVCGFTQAGAPCSEEGEDLGLHGRAASIPAGNISWSAEWEAEEYILSVSGTVLEYSLFGPNLILRREIRTAFGSEKISIRDTVTNNGFETSPLMMLQHINLGFPLVDEGTGIELESSGTRPRDGIAKKGMDSFDKFQAPTAGFKEQVFYHDCVPDDDGRVCVRVVNPNLCGGFALALCFRKEEYPLLVQWKMPGEGAYVLGIEPSTCTVGGRTQSRKDGTLQFLQPGEERKFDLDIVAETGRL